MDLTSREIKIVLNSMVFYLLALNVALPTKTNPFSVGNYTTVKNSCILGYSKTVLDPWVIHRGELVLVDKWLPQLAKWAAKVTHIEVVTESAILKNKIKQKTKNK